MMKRILILIPMILLFSCQETKELHTVSDVDLEKYMGKWYEIARLPNSFEKGLTCVTAEYRFKKNGKIKVLNRGYSGEKGKFKTATGTAWRPKDEFPGRLKVTFFWPFAGNYYIIELADDYSYALVGDPSRKYLWILAREKTISDEIRDKLIATAKSHGFAIEQMLFVDQSCN